MKPAFFIVAAAVIALLIPSGAATAQSAEEIGRDKILSSAPAWQANYDKYAPNADMVEALKTRFGSGMKVVVYLGLWCPDSRNNVPPFLKILDQVGTGVPVQYFNVPRKASRDVKFYVEEMNVEKVPTFIIYRDGKEIGRIIENPKAGMLEDLMDIVLK